jgi:hypothetical protein
MTIGYLDCFSGVSGNMLLGAILDAGIALDALKAEVAKLPLAGYEIRAQEVLRRGFRGVHVEVTLAEQPAPRRLRDILQAIETSSLDGEVQARSAEVFRRLARAEAVVHGADPEETHLHEVGAVDALVDVVGAVAGLRLLGVERLDCSPLPLGGGWAETAHGRIPVPAPATLELLKGVPTCAGPAQVELVTPTGAAIVTTLCAGFGEYPEMAIQQVGLGAGTRDLETPNLLRLVVGQAEGLAAEERLVALETNIDDTNPEHFEYVMERLYAAGALDVTLVPAIMKKSRPATLVRVLAQPPLREALMSILFRETSTLGVRSWAVQRRCLEREEIAVETPWGQVRVKVARLGDDVTTIAPEYDDCKRLAAATGAPLKEIYEAAGAAARRAVSRA